MIKLFLLILISFSIFSNEEIEEVITTGTLLKESESKFSPVEIITAEKFDEIGVSTIAEISKYLSASSGSHFQTNTMDGVDQGMSAITLRGLDHASTLLLINSKRQTFTGTPSYNGEGYVDANIIPKIALTKMEVLKEGATSVYGSDAVAGVINFITVKKFSGYKLDLDSQYSTNYNQNDIGFGFLYGKDFENFDLVFGFERMERTPLKAYEIDQISELSVSGLGNSFKILGDDVIDSGLYAGEYSNGQTIPDPNCVENGGILDGRCRFAYGRGFNIVNDESHEKFYTRLSNKNHDISLIFSNVKVNDNPQSPSYPALPFLARDIEPGVGGSPFNVPVRWYGRPLGGRYPWRESPKDISQYHVNYSFLKDFENLNLETSFTHSQHENFHNRPDIVDSRFLSALYGNGGESGNLQWNIFDPSQNSIELVEHIKGAEISNKIGDLTTFDILAQTSYRNINLAFGTQASVENLDINFNEISRAEFDSDGKIIKTADLFFLGGGKNVNESRNKYSLYFELDSSFLPNFDYRFSGRFEKSENFSSFDPKLSFKYKFFENFSFRISSGTSFTMPSMGQMFSSDIKLGSVRDIESSVFVRQAQIGNADLKPAESTNTNFGLIYGNNGNRLSFDYWEIDFENRIEGQSAQALLSEDPFGPSITRNELGDLIGVTTTYFNEESTVLSGIDYGLSTVKSFFNGEVELILQGTNLIEFLTPEQSENGTIMINRVGKHNFDAHTHSLPKNRINTFINYKKNKSKYSLIARYLDGYINNRTISSKALSLGYKNKVDSSLIFDISLELPISQYLQINNNSGDYDLKTSIGIINLFDEKAPRLYNAPDFSWDSRLHDPRGRMIRVNFQLIFNN